MTNTFNGRIRKLSGSEVNNSQAVVYVMSRDQRVDDNYALLAAQADALSQQLPLVVLFNVYPASGVRAFQHYRFMIDGLKQVSESLRQKNIPFILSTQQSQLAALKQVSKNLRLAAIYFDYSPLNRPKQERKAVSTNYDVPVYVVDTHNIVPVWEASNKREYAARTIRPKLQKLKNDYLEAPPQLQSQSRLDFSLDSVTFDQALNSITAESRPSLEIEFESGAVAARAKLEAFISGQLATYHSTRNDPAKDGLSGLSPYFHFGQLSPQRAVLEVEIAAEADSSLRDGAEVFVEEAFVRRELSDNFCEYEPNYRSLVATADWAQQTLTDHEQDPREHIYDFSQLEHAQTHDPAWNAAQTQMTKTGKMHGYMRMYWAKKILEWTEHPTQALEWAIKLNDMYEIDGNDPNGYVGCLWSIGGVHDRGWTERDIFGKIRYMNLNGLKRKFNIESYISNWTE